MDATHLTLSLLREALTGVPATLPEDTSDELLAEVFILAKRHDLAHIVGKALLSHGVTLAPRLSEAFVNEESRAVYRYHRLWHAYGEIQEALAAYGILFVPLKGAILRHLYPVASMRTSCDIDLLVKEESLDAAHEALTAIGCTEDGRTFHDVSYHLGDAHLELHYNILTNVEGLDAVLSTVWEHVETREDAPFEGRLSSTFFAFHVVAHMCEHFMRGGCGVRALLDLYLLEHSESFDAEGTRALCKQAGILPFLEAAEQLSRVWLQGKEHTSLTSLMQDFILRGGIYGTRDNRVAAGTGRRPRGKLSYLLSRIFPPRRYLALSYPSLNRFPILLPLCWVRRALRILFRGRSKAALSEIAATHNLPAGTEAATRELFNALSL